MPGASDPVDRGQAQESPQKICWIDPRSYASRKLPHSLTQLMVALYLPERDAPFYRFTMDSLSDAFQLHHINSSRDPEMQRDVSGGLDNADAP